MRPRHTPHTLPAFPVHAAAFLAPDRLVLGGGGGFSKTGVQNKIRLYSVDPEGSIDLKTEIQVEDAPTSMAADPQSNTVVCGINSSQEKILKGENENCRVFTLRDDAFQLDASRGTLPADEDDYQKVTALSPDRCLVAVAGCHHLSLLSFPDLNPLAPSIQLEEEIYDATFSNSNDTLVVATTHNLLVYSLNIPSSSPSPVSSEERAKALELSHTVDLPHNINRPCTFRSVRFHPHESDILYTVINTSSPRERGRKSPPRQGYISRWNPRTWTVERQKKVGDKALTAFDISLDGRFLGYGSSDLSIGMLDSKTLSPLCTILKAHDFPPTIVKFDPSTKLLVSGSADYSLRVVTIPIVVGGSSWTIIILLVALFIAFIAIALQSKQFG
ncbi:hypothetical protein AGABI1DRAFT_57743 [Agaricus bisporus var. burnettii JB137-S8]|uniref:WD40 repeat-like protein n=1 Tax=Agaricus bisporus var. burnettii (strain JB137-S8 / ATCC MYA-4627 / FGSC 10392) TaxID=597362 RepID=K5WXJ2_AGABU|nr:uncharacterized protein AGABI1DRAFT_57743 [Agaricus bisporus var. burnettii JB137-S8]EKM80201.1 hypothetical protein AGABI1DRAFT_57743 [Agaricus bisporus var. burnettii JB137-S8]